MRQKNTKKIILSGLGILLYAVLIVKYYDLVDAKDFFKTDFLKDIPSYMTLFILIAIIALSIILYFLLEQVNTNKAYDDKKEDENYTVPFYNETELKKEMFFTYKEVEKAYMNFDSEKLKTFLGNDIYKKYIIELKELKKEKQKKIIEDVKISSLRIYNYKEEIDHYIFETSCNISYKSYVVDENNNVISGDIYKENNERYEITYIKNKKIKDIKECPNCHCELENNTNNKCPKCNEIILKDTGHLIISDKKRVIEL